MVRWVIGLILHGGPTELFLIVGSVSKAVVCAIFSVERKEGNVLFNDALNTFYLGYMASDIW